MKKTGRITISNYLRPYIITSLNEAHLPGKIIKDLSSSIEEEFDDVFCSKLIDSKGRKLFLVKSVSTKKTLFEIEIRD